MSIETAAAFQAVSDMIPRFRAKSVGQLPGFEEIAPFVLPLLYMVAAIYQKINRTVPLGLATDKIDALKDVLRLLSERWLAARGLFMALSSRQSSLIPYPDVYLSLLEAREILLLV